MKEMHLAKPQALRIDPEKAQRFRRTSAKHWRSSIRRQKETVGNIAWAGWELQGANAIGMG
jgi:hypothetical protein